MKYVSPINPIQFQIMRELFVRGDLRFAQMNVGEVPSDQFSYHLRQLVKCGLVDKSADYTYSLSVDGRSRAILLDVRTGQYIEQGFVACRIILSRQTSTGREYLIQKRIKVPYKGNLAEPGGKVLYGEDVLEAAARNMLVETGLECHFELKGLVHFKDRYQGQIVQDKYFFVVAATNPKGELRIDGETGTNLWLTLDDVEANPKTHQGVIDMIRLAEGKTFGFLEATHDSDVY